MEDVLEVYSRPYDPARPVVCMDEASKQLVADITPPLPMQPGQPARQDYEYERRGTANLFMTCEPLAGHRHVKVTDRRTNADFAYLLRDLADVDYRHAEKIVLVSDNLDTHKPAVLYEVFPPEEARRLADRFEFHHTPKHASWLNIAECELSVLGANAWIGASTTATFWRAKSPPGNKIATANPFASTGNSPPPTPASN